MEWAALVAWVVTAAGGFYLLAGWLQRGGMRHADRPGKRIRPPLILGHFALAATGLVLWIIYLAADSDALAWIAFALLIVVAALGATMFATWRSQQTGATAAETADAPERQFPAAVVGLHGVLAVTTVVLVLLSALDIGTS